MESTLLNCEDDLMEFHLNEKLEPSARITEQEVWQAAHALWMKKVDPSSNKVREILGNRGSFRTIQMYLDSWRRQRIEEPAADDPLWQELAKMRKKYEQQANMSAKTQIHEIQHECNHKILESQELQRHLEQERDSLTKQLQALSQTTESLKDAHQLLYNKYHEQEKKLSLTEQTNLSLKDELQNTKLNAEKQANVQARDYENRLSLLTEQTERDKTNLFGKINLLEKGNNDLKQSSENKITELRLIVQELENALKQSDEKEKRYIIDIEKHNSEYTKIQEENNQLVNENSSLFEKLHNNEKELSVTKEILKEKYSQIDELKEQNKELQKQLLDYSLKVGRFEQELVSIKRNKENKLAKK